MTRIAEEAAPPPSASRPPENSSANKLSPSTVGILLGLSAALCYTGTNIVLRTLATRSDVDWQIWVTCLKSVPATLVAWGLITYRFSHGLPALPPLRLLIPLIGCGLVMQLGGNLCFQLSLAHLGLALSVPLCFSTLICTGAGLGRLFLGEPITPKTVVAMVSLIASIVLISVGAYMSKPEAVSLAGQSWGTLALAILAACVSGVSYGSLGVVIRTLVKKLSVSASLVVFSTTGLFVLGGMSIARLGLSEMANTTPLNLTYMLLAGCLNAAAFFSVGAALKHMPVVRLHLLNASQTAMCAIAGVMIFHEKLTGWLIAGTMLTIFGLVSMGMKKRNPET